ncbi:protein kinase [Streptomyces sp. NPDC087420]|uniref:serine/threonine-protein kinase n=1 Tax=Streptomyces sp. NPDC087420 TaxID=3365785 RepID=UPI0038348963
MNAWTVPGYTESRELGSGGSGRVVLAVHDGTGVPVAVKYLSESLRTDGGFVQRFRAEARLLGALDSPYVVGLYEYVEAPPGAAIVMELVDGVALRALLLREGPTGPEAALTVLKGSLLGLAAAHRGGVVHRDYKPENVLVAADGSSKLVDFGIAADRGTIPGVAGTPSYMAPEQWNGEPASPAADVYAATATFYECLTGRKPFRGENFAELALQHIEAPIPEEEAPEAVRPLIRRGLAKDPGDRPEDAEAFVAELEEIAGAAYGPDWEERGRGRLAALAALLPLLLPSAAGEASGTTALATTALGAAGAGRHLRPGIKAVLTGVAALVVAVVVAVAAGATGDAPRRTTAQSVATTSALPSVTGPSGGGSPTSSAGPSGSGSPLPSDSASPDPSGGTTAEPGAPTPDISEPTPGATDTTAPAEPPPSGKPSGKPSGDPLVSPPPTPPVTVTSVTVSDLRQVSTSGATATLDIATDGAGPVSVVVTWFAGTAKGELGTPDGSTTFERSGATHYTLALDHTFTENAKVCYWGVRATTDPAAANGGSSQQIQTRRGCSAA